MPKPLLSGKHVLVLGLGLHGGGVAVTRWLVKNKANVVVTDIKTRQQLASSIKNLHGLPIKFVLGKHPIKLLKDCQMIVQNPGVPADSKFLLVAKKAGIPIENEASLFLKLCPTKKLVAVTGTRGKSTTVSVLGTILREKWPSTLVAGNIRDTVLFDILDKLTSNSVVVLELSSWQLEVVGQHKLRIPTAVITNVMPDHLNRYKNFASYSQAKANIFRSQNKEDSLILNYDNDVTKKFSRLAKSRVYWFSQKKEIHRGCFVRSGNIYWRNNGKDKLLFKQDDINIIGSHNVANILAASTAAALWGVGATQIKKGIKKFKGLHDRLEFVRKFNNVSYYNDTTSTTPDSAIAALKAFKNKSKILIAGGMDKKLSYKELAEVIKHQSVVVILLPGTATPKIQQALRGYKKQLLARTMNEAVGFARDMAAPDSIVLLSPAAASFGLFLHEFDRGQKFIQAVKLLN